MTTEIENTVQGLLRAYREAAFAKDIEAFVAIYDEDIEVFDVWGPAWLYQGIESWRGMAERWFAGLGDERVLVEMDHVHIKQVHGAAFVSAFVKYTALSAKGESSHSLWNRLTWVLEPREGDWKVIFEHTSAPADHDTLQVSLRP
jgi:uncharacterized protein (TIGR02246 family)